MSAAARGSNRRGLGSVERSTDGEGYEAGFVCPRCHEDAVVESECSRCRVMTVSRDGAVFLRSRRIGPARFTGSVTLTLILLGVAGIPLLLHNALSTVDRGIATLGRANIGPGSTIALLATLAVVLPLFGLAGQLVARAARSLRARRAFGRVRARHTACRLTPLSELPSVTSDEVRVAGTVRVDETGTLRIQDGSGTRVRVDVEQATASDARGEVLVLREGDRVDVIGRGARVPGAGDGYRDAGGEFAFVGEVDILRQDA